MQDPVNTFNQADITLQAIVQVVTRHSVQFPITLMVGGSLVTGMVIPEASYHNQHAAGFLEKSGGNTEAKSDFVQVFAGFVHDAINAGHAAEPQYIHLENARVFNGGPSALPSHGVLWRGKIASIDGYFLGSLSSAE